MKRGRSWCGPDVRVRPMPISPLRGANRHGQKRETDVHGDERRSPQQPGVWALDQPVNRGATSFLAQRWKHSRIDFGFVPEPDWKVTLATRRWTPIFSLSGLTRSWISLASFVFLTFLTTLPSSTKVTVAILLPRIEALKALPTQPVGPFNWAAPGTIRSGSRSCSGWVRSVWALPSSLTQPPS